MLQAGGDTLEREIVFVSDARGRIVRIRDFLGREVRYDYGAQGDLVRATSPVVLESTQGAPLAAEDRFPAGKSEIYGYENGFADERLNHNLVLRVAPNQAARVAEADLERLEVLRPLAVTETEYGKDPGSPSFDRVVRQRHGGRSWLPAWTETTLPQEAGGVFVFAYEDLRQRPGFPARPSLNQPVEVTRLFDRNGNLHEYFHNAAGQCVRLREYTNREVRPSGPNPGQDPEFYEETRIYDKDGLLLARVRPQGGVYRYVYGDEDLDGDGRLTAGEDRNGDGDFDDPEDVQPEDDARFAFRAGNGVLDALPRAGAANLLLSVHEPDARGDTRGGRRPRTTRRSYEPIYNQLRSVTDARGNDADYRPQNGGVGGPERYTSTRFFDYQQGTQLLALAAEIGESPARTAELLAEAGVVLGLGDLNQSPLDDGHVQGDVVRSESPAVRLTAGQSFLQRAYGDSLQRVVSLSEFNAFGQLVRSVDPEGNVQLFAYYPEGDPNGDGVPDSSLPGATGGYLREAIRDAERGPGRDTGLDPQPVQQRESFAYDAVGNLVRRIDPRGIEHRYEVNALNQVVVARAASDTTGLHPSEPNRALPALDYETHYLYDFNDNLVEVRVENAGERDGSALRVPQNPFWTRKTAYDILDDPVVRLVEVEPVFDDEALSVSSPGVIVTRLGYDPNENLSLVQKPEGNLVRFVYDERDLLFETVDGAGSPEQAVTRRYYNANGNQKYFVDAKKHNPGKRPEFSGDVTEMHYSGFDEAICVLDAEGNFSLT
ncbi:MAG: hypothetical protein D6731_11680, partial [Planctomycetota bacterium]